MTAKQKASKDNDAVDPYLESGKDPELEKKVDAMLSMDSPLQSESEPETSDLSDAEDDSEVMQVTSDLYSSDAEKDGAPLLPSRRSVNAKTQEAETAEKTASNLPVESPGDDKETPLLPDDLVAATLKPTHDDKLPKDEIVAEEPAASASHGPVDLPLPPEGAKDEFGLDDVGTTKAVDEIIAADADELLDARDNGGFSKTAPAAASPKSSNHKGIGAFFSAWWHSKRYRNATFAVLLLALAATAATPASRYYVLNTAGVRSGASVLVLDETTGQPLKNADFSIGNSSGKTDKEGKIKLTELRLGSQTMVIKKAAFAEVSKPVTLGWGSNPLGEFRLKAVGNQYKITVTDFLSKKALTKVEASSGEANALTNDKGEIVLTVPRGSNDKEEIDIQLSGEGLRTENLKLALGKKDSELVQMAPSRKHVFISKRSGTYDVYKVDVDGKNEEKVLSGTGSERPDAIALSIHPTKNIAALVSARDNSRNKDGFVLSSLTIIDLGDNKATKVTQSERVQLIGWVDSKLAYVKITEGASAASSDRHKLISYDMDSSAEKELYSTNYFNDILMVDKAIYYTPASYNVNGSVGLFKTNLDGSDKKTIFDKEVWNLFRTSYDKLSVSMGQDWFDLNLNTDVMTRANSAPPILKTRIYMAAPDNTSSLWADDRDGKGVLLSYEPETRTDKILQSQSGLKNPIRWLTQKHIIYRVSNNQEIADYIFSTEGGEPRKISDVTDTAGLDRWYYY